MMSCLTAVAQAKDWSQLEDVLRKDSANLDVNVRDKDGMTALMYASFYGNEGSVRLLLAHGADPNLTLPTSETTPLMFAMMSGNAQVVSALLQCGADPHTVNSKRRTALDIGAFTGNRSCCEALRKYLGVDA
ncbi:hypothetical protein PTSG_02355 [Salpingoeca rosetta]|uniref:Uncharacterized protein n=1 Tax=Salpingoeca rosetta (strain ATCC 50818 / BSB-021) TaxID=946362 RepID=F2U1Y7_SALR5|nr:uncharacterized protein PTSG_02355 [Salpingoeca rosetta]EGD81639.1 hypothetical protein PTSG_02355 [Salpingoeca rosetta]|eukprot:XP_004996843.1 hypothetical protein PTSG_02355 [Salpingoeca rosetta]